MEVAVGILPYLDGWMDGYRVWLLDGEQSLMISLAVLTEYRRVTDRRTNNV